MAIQENLTNCPFCHKLAIKILHIPFVCNTFSSTCRAGGKTTTYQRERFDVLSGCSECGRTMKDIQKAFDRGESKEITSDEHKKRLERLKAAGFGTKLVTTRR